MSDQTTVYDLGVVDAGPSNELGYRRRSTRSGGRVRPANRPLEMIADTIELFLPGIGQMLRGRWADGLFVLSGTGFIVSLAWAIWATRERLPGTLEALGFSPHGGVYALALLYVFFAGLHASNVLYGTSRGPARAHPAVAGFFSALVPGWGQLLNQQPAKAAAFVAALWGTGVMWLLGSPRLNGWLDAQGVALRPGLEALSNPVVLWSVPIGLWLIAVYDAVAAARR